MYELLCLSYFRQSANANKPVLCFKVYHIIISNVTGFFHEGKKSLKAYSSCVELTEDRMLQRWSGALFEVHL